MHSVFIKYTFSFTRPICDVTFAGGGDTHIIMTICRQRAEGSENVKSVVTPSMDSLFRAFISYILKTILSLGYIGFLRGGGGKG